MIYNSKIKKNNLFDHSKLISIFSFKEYVFYGIIGFLLSRISILFYMAPVGISFSMACLFKKNKLLSLTVAIFSIFGYFSIADKFLLVNLYIILNMFVILVSFLNIKKINKISITFVSFFLLIFFYRFLMEGYFISSTLFFIIVEMSIIIPLYFIFSNFLNVIKNYNNERIFQKEQVMSLIITFALGIVGFNNIDIFNFDITNIFLVLFIFVISYVNGVAIGMVSGVLSGTIMGFVYGNFSEYISIYSVISCVSSILYTSSRLTVSFVSIMSILILKLSTSSLISISDNGLIFEIFIAIVLFMIIPKNTLNNMHIHLNEESKKEYFTQKRLFNTLDMRIQKINNFNDIIKYLSDMIVSNVNFKYKVLDKKIYIEILAENVCSGCKIINSCWKNNFNIIRNEFLNSLDNYIEGNKVFTDYIKKICKKQKQLNDELIKISNFYNMQRVYEEKIYEAQDMLSYELKNLHDIIELGVKEFKKDIIVKVNLEKNLINNFNKYNIRYSDFVCYEENDKVKVKIIMDVDVYSEFKLEILNIVNLSLLKDMIVLEDMYQYVNEKKEIILSFVEKYNFNVISHCLQVSKFDKNGDNYIFYRNPGDNYVIAISDGMGSGKEAYDKSKFTIDLLDKFMKTSIDLTSCIKEITSIISLKFFRDESISTIDFSSINLYTGKMSYLKLSAICTYVKRGFDVFVLENTKDPLVNFYECDDYLCIGEFDLQCGDIVVHITDGVIHFQDLSKQSWLYNFLRKTDICLPDKLCEEIMYKFKEINRESSQDDATVIVSKIYKNYVSS